MVETNESQKILNLREKNVQKKRKVVLKDRLSPAKNRMKAMIRLAGKGIFRVNYMIHVLTYYFTEREKKDPNNIFPQEGTFSLLVKVSTIICAGVKHKVLRYIYDLFVLK